MLPGESRIICVIEDVFPALDLCYTDPAQHPTTAVWNLNDLYRDLSHV